MSKIAGSKNLKNKKRVTFAPDLPETSTTKSAEKIEAQEESREELNRQKQIQARRRARIHNHMIAVKERKNEKEMQNLLMELNKLKVENMNLKAMNESSQNQFKAKDCEVLLLNSWLENAALKAELMITDMRIFKSLKINGCKSNLKIISWILRDSRKSICKIRN